MQRPARVKPSPSFWKRSLRRHSQARDLGSRASRSRRPERGSAIVLPQPLKEFLAVAGGSRDLLNADYIFLPPEQLRMAGGYLIFCEQRQGLEDFGIALADIHVLSEQSNPPVEVRPNSEVRWLRGEGELSAFLLGMTAWQSCAGCCLKRAACSRKELKKLLDSFEPVGAADVRVGSSRFGLVDRISVRSSRYYQSMNCCMSARHTRTCSASWQSRRDSTSIRYEASRACQLAPAWGFAGALFPPWPA